MRSYSLQVATAVVVANMVGTGVFTSLPVAGNRVDGRHPGCGVGWTLCSAHFATPNAHHTASGGEYTFSLS